MKNNISFYPSQFHVLMESYNTINPYIISPNHTLTKVYTLNRPRLRLSPSMHETSRSIQHNEIFYSIHFFLLEKI